MGFLLASVCFVAATCVALAAVVTEYRQTRAKGPLAIVGTMQGAPTAALFSLLGLLTLPTSLGWWWYPIVPSGVLLVGGWAILRAGKRRS